MIRLLIISLILLNLYGCATLENNVHQYNTPRGVEITVPYEFFFSTEKQWEEVEQKINNAPSMTVTLLWEGRGGYDVLGHRFIKFLQHTNKKVIFKIIGMAASEHAIVTCYSSRMVMTPYGVLMFHLRADGQTPDKSIDSIEENTYLMGVCLRKGIVTSKDIKDVNSDKEVWIYADGHREVLPDRRNK